MSETKEIPCAIFDHVVWSVQAADGRPRLAEILHGECILLFTSLDSAETFLNGSLDCDDAQRPRPVVFSRNRKEFGRAARQAAQLGIIGALFDPEPGTGEAPFLQFSRCDR